MQSIFAGLIFGVTKKRGTRIEARLHLLAIFIFSIVVTISSLSMNEITERENQGQARIIYHVKSSNLTTSNLGDISANNITFATPIIETFRSSVLEVPSAMNREFLFVVTVNARQVAIFSWWLQWAKIAGLTKFVVFAMDEKAAVNAISHNLQTVSPFYRSSFNDKMTIRHGFFLSLLSKGISFISMEANALMLDLSSFSIPEKDIYLSFRGSLPANFNDRVRLHADLFGISPSMGVAGLDFMQRVGHCISNGTLVKPISARSATQHYQSCMEKSIWAMNGEDGNSNPKISQSISFFDGNVVATSRQLFKWNAPQSKGFIPAMLLVDEPVDDFPKEKLLREWSLNLDEEGSHPYVKHAPYVSHSSIEAKPTASVKGIILTIRIISMDRPSSLKRLLASLSNAYYDSDTVNIEFYVDKPKSTSEQTANEAVVEVVNAFQWKHGPVRRIFEEQNAGIFKMWVRPFPTDTTDPMTKPYFMVLEDDVEVSPYFYYWVKKVLQTYSKHEDGNLFGFTIQRSQGILGIKKHRKWTEDYNDKNVSISSPFFRYQMLSTWGQIFFPRHWNAFVDWAVVARNKVGFQPCVPYLNSNEWYLQKPQSIWSVWFTYFAYSSGLTNMFINYNHLSEKVNYALLVNYRESGLHFSTPKKNSNSKGEVLINARLQFDVPPMSRIPLYDYFFNLVTNENLLMHQWRFTSNIGKQCIKN